MLSFSTHLLGSLFHFLFVLSFAFCSNRSDTFFITKRKPIGALWNLNEMAECKLHYTALVYDDYGCWCGIGGSGTPIDGIDSCCKLHDQCYDLAVDQKFCYDIYVEYAEPYSWSCQREEPTCFDKQVGCKAALCECDKQVVDCWSKFAEPLKRKKCSKPNNGEVNVNLPKLLLVTFSIFVHAFYWRFLRSLDLINS